jgi:hypothetical protein
MRVMPEPISTISGAVTHALTAIKDLPLWLLGGIALSLISFISFPEFGATVVVPQQMRPWVNLGAITFIVLTACRLGSLVISHINSYRTNLEARRTFHLTPMSHNSFWGASPRGDGTIVTENGAMLIAKNRTNKNLHLATARVIRPKISGEVLDVSIRTGSETSDGLYYLLSGETEIITVSIHIGGFPRRVRKKLPNLAAVLAVADDEGNEQRVKLSLTPSPLSIEFLQSMPRRWGL